MILVGIAAAAPVVCDPAVAERLVRDARIDVQRVPATHPWLVPGLARNASDPEVAAAVAAACEGGGGLVLRQEEQYSGAGWAAYAFVLSRTEDEGCSKVHYRLPLSVGIGPDGPSYRLLGEIPPERTPRPGCPDPAIWRDETVVAGEDAAVRLVLAVDRRDETVTHSHVAVRTASALGWSEQILRDPAPPRLLLPEHEAAGPTIALARTEAATLVVESGDRTPEPCRPLGGQTVWRSGPSGWTAVRGREALTLLAREGLWRYAGDDGWLLILAQDDEEDIDLVDPRRRRLQRRDPEPLFLLYSSDFPGLNAGYVVVSPGPWPTEAEALAAKGRWKRSAWAYVKQAWSAPDPCSVR